MTWRRIRERVGGAYATQDGGLRRVGLRLAGQTVALLLVALLALEIVVYVITRNALLQTLENTLSARAHPDPGFIHRIYYEGDIHHPPPPGGPIASEASVAYLDLHLKTVGGDGPIGNALVDPEAARQALRTLSPDCCSIRAYHGRDFLVYTDVVRDNGTVIGVAQSNILAAQYESAISNLKRTLILVAILGIVTLGAISAVLVRRSLRPIRIAMQRQRDFVADAAHELRTPLAIMRTVGEIGLAGGPGEDQQESIEQMLSENNHLTRLVDDLSLLARTDSGTVALNRAPLDLSSLVSATVAELSPIADQQGVALTAQAEPAVWVVGDVLRLRQLLLILLDNALKHTPEGGAVKVSVRSQGGRAAIQVLDSGPGIDPAALPRIFDRFYRADQARTGEGSGLGLAIGRWIAEAHGGHISAANAPGHGALFTVTLPATRAAAIS